MKRSLDLLLLILFAPLWIPVLAIVSLAVLVKLGRPIFFSQLRPGLHGAPFTLTKFRTMTDQRDTQGNLLADADRLTDFGRWLRATSLDELPELWNVVKGVMTLVGPRPLLMEYLALYTPEQARRHATRPGITGWAQINGRNAIGWEERLEMDTWYVDHRSSWLDLKILWLTAMRVFQRHGISAEGQATMPKFTGVRN